MKTKEDVIAFLRQKQGYMLNNNRSQDYIKLSEVEDISNILCKDMGLDVKDLEYYINKTYDYLKTNTFLLDFYQQDDLLCKERFVKLDKTVKGLFVFELIKTIAKDINEPNIAPIYYFYKKININKILIGQTVQGVLGGDIKFTSEEKAKYCLALIGDLIEDYFEYFKV